MNKQSSLSLPLLTILVLAACSDETNATDDPLAATWTNAECFGTNGKPADIESCVTEITFTDGLEISLEARWVSLAATETNPGCTTTKLVTGQTWFTAQSEGTFTVSGDGSATVERSNCVNAADDLPEEETTDIAIASGAQDYSISGDTLTISSGNLQGVYTR